jgi:ribonuclease VapC
MLRHETGYERIRDAIANAVEPMRIASPSYFETAIVIDGKKDPKASRTLDNLLTEFEIEVVPFTAEHARIAREAYRDYGKGSGHPARLNFGDCMAYALARSERAPLLYVGNDFSHTDIEAA